MSSPVPLLEIRELDAHYGHFQALFDVELTVADGETIAVIGANGAGKTTLLRSVLGLVSVPDRTRITLGGEPLQGLRTDRRARQGITMVPEGRRLFPGLTVEENLLVGAQQARAGTWTVDAVFDLFPNLPLLRRRPAGALSGGEQQAVAIGRGLLANPRILLLDEVSLGLAPVVVDRLYAALATIGAAGLTMVVVEQDVGQAIRMAGRVHCLRSGRTVLTAPAADLTAETVMTAYFGGAA